MQKRILVTGAAGFIGHHLVNYLKSQGHTVRGVDWKNPEYETRADEFLPLDLRISAAAEAALKPLNGQSIDEVYALAADMGGMGFIQDKKNQALILYNNSMMNLNTIETARQADVERYLYTSSACIYPVEKQKTTDVKPLKEEDAYPANPEDSYGWEKLLSERLAQYYNESHGMNVRVVRFHNIYGPEGTWYGGREKAPAALCRKIAEAKHDNKGYIEIWGDGEQTRSFCYIDDCLRGLEFVMQGSYSEPINLGRDEMVSINQLADIISDVAGVKGKLEYRHVEGPQGVRGRNSDNTLFRERYGWAPEITLQEGLSKTYTWIEKQVLKTSQ